MFLYFKICITKHINSFLIYLFLNKKIIPLSFGDMKRRYRFYGEYLAKINLIFRKASMYILMLSIHRILNTFIVKLIMLRKHIKPKG
uniref:Uncharacterized protein n=1 Tax=Strongyloides venezuelensis TaxID=75913 RepID=A0A0K0F5T2_STRVS